MIDHRELAAEKDRFNRVKEDLISAFPGIDQEDDFFRDTLEGATGLPEILDAMVELMRRDMATAQGLRTQAEAYSTPLIDRASRLEVRVSMIRNHLLRTLQDTDQRSVKRDSYSLTVKAGGKPKINVFDPDLLPPQYMKQKPPPPPEPDLNAIAEALDDPERRAEVELAASKTNGAPVLQVNLK